MPGALPQTLGGRSVSGPARSCDDKFSRVNHRINGSLGDKVPIVSLQPALPIPGPTSCGSAARAPLAHRRGAARGSGGRVRPSRGCRSHTRQPGADCRNLFLSGLEAGSPDPGPSTEGGGLVAALSLVCEQPPSVS